MRDRDRDPRPITDGKLEEFGRIPDGSDGRIIIVEKQVLYDRLFGRIRVVREDGAALRMLSKIWFMPSTLGPLIEALEALKAALDLERPAAGGGDNV